MLTAIHNTTQEYASRSYTKNSVRTAFNRKHIDRVDARGGVCHANALLRFHPNGALRLHAAHRAHVANVHETVCDLRAFFGLHRLITAGTLNDGSYADLALHATNHLFLPVNAEEVPAGYVARETRFVGVA